MASSATELFTPVSKIPLTGRLLPIGEATDGEATISPHSSSSSSTRTFEPTDGADGGGTSCREDLLSGSGALEVTPVLVSNVDEGTSRDCLTARLGGREEAGVADPLVMVLQPKAGLFGGPGMLNGDGDGRLLTPGDRGGKLLTPVDKLREWTAADFGCRDRGRGTVAEVSFGGCALFLLPKISSMDNGSDLVSQLNAPPLTGLLPPNDGRPPEKESSSIHRRTIMLVCSRVFETGQVTRR